MIPWTSDSAVHGLSTASAYYQRILRMILKEPGFGPTTISYIDDVLYFGADNLEEHTERVRRLLKRLNEVRRNISVSKIKMARKRVE